MPGIKDALERADYDPASAFEAAILSPLHSVPKAVGNRRYLLIDALDEALTHSKRPTILEVLAARINLLPPWLGIVATTRSEPGVLSQLRGLPAQALKADDPKNQDDVRAFLERPPAANRGSVPRSGLAARRSKMSRWNSCDPAPAISCSLPQRSTRSRAANSVSTTSKTSRRVA